MLKKEWTSRLSAAGFAALFVFGCSPDSTGSRLVTVRLSLARADATLSAALATPGLTAASVDTANVISLIVTLDSVQIQTSAADGWKTLIPAGAPLTVDLKSDLDTPIDLGTTDVETGPCEARLFVDLVTDGKTPTITFKEQLKVGGFDFAAGTTYPVTIPSGAQTGLKTDGTCEILANQTNVSLVFDENATMGTIAATGSGRILLTPVIHVRQQPQ